MEISNPRQEAQRILAGAIQQAKSFDSGVVLLRPISYISVLKKCPALIAYAESADGIFIPTCTDDAGHIWPITISEAGYQRVEKIINATGRGMRIAG